MPYISMEKSELNELYKEAHENKYNNKIKSLLIEMGANPNVIGYSMYDIITMTPNQALEVFSVEIIQEEPNIELIKNILEHSIIDVNVKIKRGDTALMWASEKGHTGIVRMLLEKPEILVNVQRNDGWTALMWASGRGRTEIVRMLLERTEILVNVQDNRGFTALMMASECSRTEIVRMLLDHPKIDKTLKHNNRTAWGMASFSLREQCPDLQPKRKSTTKTNLKKDLLKAIESGKDISEIKKILETT